MTQQNRKYALSPAQEVLWKGQLLSADVPLYNMAMLFKLEGLIEPHRFQRVFDTLLEDYDTLRTVYSGNEGSGLATVLADFEYQVPVVDLTGHSGDQITDWLEVRTRKVMQLDKCCFDSVLLMMPNGTTGWYLNQHHLSADAWSMANLYRACAGRYEAQTGNTNKEILIPSDYYAHQQKNSLSQTETSNEGAGVWVPPPQFYGFTRTARHTHSRRISRALNKEAMQTFGQLLREGLFASFTPALGRFNVISTAALAFLARVSEQEELCIGIPLHNRTSQSLRNMVGMLVELMPLKCKVDPDLSLVELHDLVREKAMSLFKESSPGTAHSTLSRQFNVVINIITATFDDFAGMSCEPQWIHNGHVDPDHALRIQVVDLEGTDELEFYLDFNLSWFDEACLEDYSNHFMNVLHTMLHQPETRVGHIPLLENDQYPGIGSQSDFGSVAPLQKEYAMVTDRFLQQINRNPHAIALTCGDQTLTYDELGKRVHQLLGLIKTNNKQNLPVAIHMQRSVDLIASIFAVLMSGAAFVPLPLNFPTLRLQRIIHQSNTKLVLTDNGDLSRTCQDEGILLVDTSQSGYDVVEGSPVDSNALAYLMFTSGSSGTPKGVMVDNEALARYVDWAIDSYVPCNQEQRERVVFPFFSSIGFDLTLTSIFVPLCSGGAVRIYPEEPGPSDLAILDVIREDVCDVIKLTPSHLGLWSEKGMNSSRLHTLIIGGENLETVLAERVQNALGEAVRLFNEYGPTEAVVGCMIHKYNQSTDAGHSVPIGIAADGVEIYLLDEGGNPVAAGLVGEIYVAGNRLARGYAGAPELSAGAFVDDPWNSGRPMYRTGDLARADKDGILTYLGRKDDQVKIRGTRIELSELAAVLEQAEHVQSVHVDVRTKQHATRKSSEVFCRRCGISSFYPVVDFDQTGTCNMCREYDSYRDRAQSYFRTLPELKEKLTRDIGTEDQPYDCVMLLSGGKDSTYALCRLVDLGIKVFALTLDNGYLSNGAIENIRKVVTDINVDHEFVSTPHMNRIFADSLKRHSSVCYGCFKTIYTLALIKAHELGIPKIVTGLSQGQFFETRLVKQVFDCADFDPDEIDRQVLETRKIYHRLPDEVTASLDMTLFETDDIFNQVEFVDFYRYCDTSVSGIYAYLDQNVSWLRPEDTGRSTNCLINETGIHVHKVVNGYHNYALPYSWDVRLGHKTREEALGELDDEIDLVKTHEILDELNIDPVSIAREIDTPEIIAYYTADCALNGEELHAFMADRLPAVMVPRHFVQLENLPFNNNGKLDPSALPGPAYHEQKDGYEAPVGDVEKTLASVFGFVLRIDKVGRQNRFFDLGGDSIVAIQLVSKCANEGIIVTPNDLFLNQSVYELAKFVVTHDRLKPENNEASVEDGADKNVASQAQPFRVANDQLKHIADLLKQ